MRTQGGTAIHLAKEKGLEQTNPDHAWISDSGLPGVTH